MMNNVVWMILIVVFILVFVILGKTTAKKLRWIGEEETLRIIKNFIQQKGWIKNDYLLVRNLILAKENYWSCEIGFC